jgi:hypothetical protein
MKSFKKSKDMLEFRNLNHKDISLLEQSIVPENLMKIQKSKLNGEIERLIN